MPCKFTILWSSPPCAPFTEVRDPNSVNQMQVSETKLLYYVKMQAISFAFHHSG